MKVIKFLLKELIYCTIIFLIVSSISYESRIPLSLVIIFVMNVLWFVMFLYRRYCHHLEVKKADTNSNSSSNSSNSSNDDLPFWVYLGLIDNGGCHHGGPGHGHGPDHHAH